MQEECANRLYSVYTLQLYGWWRIMNILLIIKCSHVDVMRHQHKRGVGVEFV